MDDALLLIDDAVRHIKSQQQPDGSFLSLSSTDPKNFSDSVQRSTTFFTSTILLCLTSVDLGAAKVSQKSAKDIRAVAKKAAAFLLKQKGEAWTFNYWSASAPERTSAPYPDDLDDTFTALAALHQYNKKLIDGQALSCIMKTLTALETREGGPYRTWVVGNDAPKKWKDVDLPVNAIIGYFLALLDVTLPNIERFIGDAIIRQKLESPYYPHISHALYCISRLCKVGRQEFHRQDLVRLLAKKNLGDRSDPLEAAMAIATASNLDVAGYKAEAGIALISKTVKKDGWRAYPFCIDPALGQKRTNAGASALTAAFCVEALVAYAAIPHRAKINSDKDKKGHATVHRHIQNLAREATLEGTGELRAVAKHIISKTVDERITAPPFELKKILRTKRKFIPMDIVEQLSLGSLYGWMAYTIYDDLLDDDGDPLLLSCANFFMRKLHDIYYELDKSVPGARELFDSATDEMDAANTWEQIHCRIPPGDNRIPRTLPRFGTYDRLASKSIGHAMGPLAVALTLGQRKNSKEYKNILKFFRRYLVARQLNDDAHDWSEDLLRGQIVSVGAAVLAQFQKKFPTESRTGQITDLMPKLQEMFWGDVMVDISKEISRHTDAARKIRESSALLSGSGFMESALAALEAAGEKAVLERDRAIDFARNYGSKQPTGKEPKNPLS
jgi:hypothetical protein